MLNFGASKPRVKGGPGPLGPPGSAPVYTPLKEKVPYKVDPVHLFLSLSSESEFRQKPPPIALSAVACININL